MFVDAKAYHKENRQAQGLPRAYSIRFANATVDQDHPELNKLNGQTLLIGEHGSNDTGMLFNGHEIHPDDTSFSPATNTYSFKTSLKAAQTDVGAFINLAGTQAGGVLAVGDKTFNIMLDPAKVWFDVKISANAGAYFSTGDQRLKWDSTSQKWTDAIWELSGLTFGYDNKNIGDELQARWVAENTFIDNSVTPPATFDLAATPMTYASNYTSTMSPSNPSGASMLTQVVIPPPEAPASRADKPVKSVFPTIWQVQFSPFGNSFVGAYQDANQNVYAVSGKLRAEDDTSLVDALSAPPECLPVMNINLAAEKVPNEVIGGAAATDIAPKEQVSADSVGADEFEGQRESKMMAAEPVFHTLVSADGNTGAPSLAVFDLLNLNPMVADPEDPSGWRDSVAKVAMNDFHDLIVYFMDTDLRATFVQATAPVLPPALLAVANDDTGSGDGENKTFYKKLQVPFITSMLASGTFEQGKYCNGKRADARLKDIPSNDEVYKRHSAKLYRARYIEKFPSIGEFLRDQHDNDYSATMQKYATKMKDNIAAKSAGMKGPSNPEYDTKLLAVQKEVDDLVEWAEERSLYWALQLLYHVQQTALPLWYGQYTSGANTNSLSMMQKQLNALFGLLENNQTNTKKGGRNFMQAYNEDMRLFHMTSIIPTLVDPRGNVREIDSLVAECLAEYIEHFKASPDDTHVQAVKAAQELVGAAAGSWNLTMSLWETTVKDATWFKNMATGAKVLAVFESAAGAAFLLLPLLPGAWDHLTDQQKLSWKLLIQGSVKFYYLFDDISGFWNSLQCILGFEGVIDAIPEAADKIQGIWARFFTRTSKQTLQMQERELFMRTELIGETEYSEFSNTERLWGRNMGELLGTVAGLALAAVSIVMTAIDLANQHDPLLIGMDVIMIISSVIQILAVAAGWIAVAGAAAAEGTMLATLASYSAVSLCATWGGPVAIAFALIGIVVFIVWYSRQDHRDPITKFLDDQAQPTGLRMPGEKQAPEYFGVVPADLNNPSLVGLSVRGPLVSVESYQIFPAEDETAPFFGSDAMPPLRRYDTLKIADSQQQFISLDVVTKSPSMVDKIDYSMNTVWSLDTDPDGQSMIYTASMKENEGPDGLKYQTRTLWYLATSDDYTQVVYRELPSKENKDERAKVLPHVQWTIDVLTQPTQDAPDVKNDKGVVITPGNVLSAIVGISQNQARLGRWVDRKTLKVDAGLGLATDGNAHMGGASFPDKMLCATWTVSMAPIGPSDFKYLQQNWKIYDNDTDLRNTPHFTQWSQFSDGLQWTINPPLPTGVFELVTAAGQDEGMIRQVEGKTAPVMAATTYTVSCSLLANGVPAGTRTTEVVIEVVHDPGL
ncbi:hypothetical protein HJFPF1_10362 [Paramyrothecium foliicola]|nr:hypothetical protein HJFPF1_10362 [Paramyrothecium foliicola]